VSGPRLRPASGSRGRAPDDGIERGESDEKALLRQLLAEGPPQAALDVDV